MKSKVEHLDFVFSFKSRKQYLNSQSHIILDIISHCQITLFLSTLAHHIILRTFRYYYDTQHQIPPLLSKIYLSPYTISTMPHKPCHVFNLHQIPYFAPIWTISENSKFIQFRRASNTRITSILVDVSICFLFAVNVKVNYWGQMKILR